MKTTNPNTGSMRMRVRNCIAIATFAVAAIFGQSNIALAETWPKEPVRIIVPFAPGGGADQITRILATKLASNLGESFVVENRPGAGGNIGSSAVSKAAPDGHTLLVSAPGNFAINQFLYSNLPYSPEKDLVGISVLAEYALVLVVNPELKAKSLQELIALAKASPGSLDYASGALGGTSHLTMELLCSAADIKMTNIVYKGAAHAVMDVIAGHVQMSFDALPAFLPHIKSGALRAIAVSSAERSHLLPDTPTVAESGLSGFQATAWFAMAAPAGTSQELLEKINSEVLRALQDEEVHAKLKDMGLNVVGTNLSDTDAFFKSESAKWRDVVETTGVALD